MRTPFFSLLERAGLTERRCAVCLAPFAPASVTPVSDLPDSGLPVSLAGSGLADAGMPVAATAVTSTQAPHQPRRSAVIPLQRLVCAACAEGLSPYTGQACPLCGMPPAAPQDICVPCGACLVAPPPWMALHFFGLYKASLKEQLLRFKYGEDLSLIPLLGNMLALASAPLLPVDLLVAMPRHESRLRERGFNQVHELARVAACTHRVPLLPDSLRRTRPTPPQAQLSAKERQHNPQGSFAASGVEGKRVLLVDDIMTTGATLRHAANALLAAGAATVSVAVVARAVFKA